MLCRPEFRVTLAYFLFGFFWILFSDSLVVYAIDDPQTQATVQLFKGWFYILITTVLLYFLVRANVRQIERHEEEKREIFVSTMQTMQHILNNFLNKAMYHKHQLEEEERPKDALLEEFEEVVFKTSEQIRTLGDIDEIHPNAIRSKMETEGEAEKG